MTMKTLLVAFSTIRAVEGEDRRVRFAAKSVVDLTAKELEEFDALTKTTGKLYYRTPVNEGGEKVQEDTPELVETRAYAGEDVAIDSKSVDQLKAYLTFKKVTFEKTASKADLVKLAKAEEADGGL